MASLGPVAGGQGGEGGTAVQEANGDAVHVQYAESGTLQAQVGVVLPAAASLLQVLGPPSFWDRLKLRVALIHCASVLEARTIVMSSRSWALLLAISQPARHTQQNGSGRVWPPTHELLLPHAHGGAALLRHQQMKLRNSSFFTM